jgi:hypothetical protein
MAIRTAEDFYRAVKAMREAQKYHAKNNSPIAGGTAARYEAEIDGFIKERERRLADQKQGTLIGGEK